MIEWDDEGKAVKIAAMPISLGFHDKESRGFPRPATKEDSDALFEQLQRTCAPYGTTVTVDEDGMFIFSKAED